MGFFSSPLNLWADLHELDVVVTCWRTLPGEALAECRSDRDELVPETLGRVGCDANNFPSNRAAAETRRADILVTAAGHPRLITGIMAKSGPVVIDVGIDGVEGELAALAPWSRHGAQVHGADLRGIDG